jgi:hypothetical protein
LIKTSWDIHSIIFILRENKDLCLSKNLILTLNFWLGRDNFSLVIKDKWQYLEEITILSDINLIKGIGLEGFNLFEYNIISVSEDIGSSLHITTNSLNKLLKNIFGLTRSFHIFSKDELIITEFDISNPLTMVFKY